MESNLFVYDNEAWAKAVRHDYLIDEPAGIAEYKNALILPPRYIPGTSKKYGDGLLEGGVCTADFSFIAGLRRSHSTPYANKSCISAYEVEESQIEHRNEKVIFGGQLTSHFGHMLVDGTSRLWYLSAHPDDETKVVFVVNPKQTFKFWELLELAGIKRDRVEIIEQPTLFDTVIVPDETSYSLPQAGFKAEWRNTLQRIRDNVEPAEHEKVYFTRTRFANSGCIGEDYFEEMFRRAGFHVVAPETLTFSEQVALIAGAKTFAATAGTIAHHIMFANPGTELICLNRSEGIVDALLPPVQASESKLTVVDVHENFLPESQGGSSVHLLAPTTCWKEFISSRKDFAAINEVPDYPKAENVLKYLAAWGKTYDTHRHYRWIRNATVPDVVRRVNKYLLGNDVDTRHYLPTARLESCEVALRAQELQILDLRARALDVALATLENEDGAFRASGLLKFPFPARAESLQAHFEIASSDGRHEEIDSVFDYEVVDEQSLAWHARFNLERGYDEGSLLRGQLSFTCNGTKMALPLVANRQFDQPAFIAGLQNGVVAISSFKKGENALLEFVNAVDLVSDPVGYAVEDIHWENDAVFFAGRLDLGEIPSSCLDVELALVAKDADAGTLLQQPASFSWRDRTTGTWEASVSCVDAMPTFGQATQKTIELVWRFSSKQRSKTMPFGAKRPAGSIAEYLGNAPGNGVTYCKPKELRYKNLGFELVDSAAAIAADALPRIEESAVSEGCLEFSGSLDGPLVASGDYDCAVVLVSEQGHEIGCPTHTHYDKNRRKRLFETRIELQRLFEDGGQGLWHLAMKKTVGAHQNVERFGRRRVPGTRRIFDACGSSTDGLVLVPGEYENKELGFMLESVENVLSTGLKPHIDELSWAETTLKIKMHYPLKSLRFLECDVRPTLVSGEDHVELAIIDANKDPEDQITWNVAADIEELLSQATLGTWQLALKKTSHETVSFEVFGRIRPKGTYAIFKDAKLQGKRRKIVPKDFGDSLGFAVAEKSLRDAMAFLG